MTINVLSNTYVLKPCPFCGEEPKLHKRLNAPMYTVICKDTKCQGHNLYLHFWDKDSAIRAWNRRMSDGG